MGQAGRPKAITGFQTHTTPVLLGYGERAELATDDCEFFFLFWLILLSVQFYYAEDNSENGKVLLIVSWIEMIHQSIDCLID